MPVSLSILICTRNRAAHLRQTLASAARLAVPPGYAAELIVVDNASTDDTAEVVRAAQQADAPPSSLPMRLVEEVRPGLSHARNTALRAAQGELLLFTDDDVRLPTDWIAGLCRPLLAGTADAVAGKIVLAPSLERPWMQPFHRVVLAATEFMKADDPGVLFGASMAFRRQVLDRVPGFDPALGAGQLGAGEETLFAWQLLQAGYRLTTAFDVPVEHHPDPSRLSRAAYLDAARKRGQAYTYIRHHWFHEPAAHWHHRRIPSVRLSLRFWQLQLARWRRQGGPPAAEGIAEQEFKLVERVHRLQYYLSERNAPPHYDRLGLARRGAA